MASLQTCIDWNTNAVALTLAGRKDEAIVTIKKSLKVLETLFNASKEQDTVASTTTTTASSSRGTHSPQQSSSSSAPIVSVPILRDSSAVTMNSSPANLFTFYPRMFRIVDSTNLSISKILVVLLYNLAVTSHADALSSPASEDASSPSPSPGETVVCPRRLKRILELYETAMRVAHASWTSRDAEELLCVLLALTNNVGHVHSHLLNFRQTRESLSLQMHLLAQATDENPLSMDDYEIYFESVCIFLDGHDLCLAPAA